MGISLNEALNNKIISEKVNVRIPKKCLYGNEIVFSDSLKKIECIKEDCKCRRIYRLKQFCYNIGIQISSVDIKHIIDKLNIVSPYQLLLIDGAYKNNMISTSDSNCISELVQKIEEMKEKEYYLYEIVGMCGIKKISSIAYEIAFGFEDIDELYNEIEVGQISFINDRLGINNSDTCILSLDILQAFIELKEELIFAESVLKVKKYKKDRLFIAFNDNAQPYVNKQEVIDILNSKFNNTFVHVSVISNSTDILVKNFDATTNKFRAARLVNDKLIAEQINIGNIELNDIGKFKDKQLKPIGSKIYIGNTEDIINRLEYIKE